MWIMNSVMRRIMTCEIKQFNLTKMSKTMVCERERSFGRSEMRVKKIETNERKKEK